MQKFRHFWKKKILPEKVTYTPLAPSHSIDNYSYFSGPKRYDLKNGSWIYTHDGACLHDLLSSEISLALGHEVDFTLLPRGGADGNGW